MSTTPRPPLLSDEEIDSICEQHPYSAQLYAKQTAVAIISRHEAARAKDAEEIAKWKGIVKGVHGALTDIGTVPVPAMDADLYDAVMSIRAKDAELIQRLLDALEQSRRDGRGALSITMLDAIDAAAAAGFTPTEP